MLDPTVIQKGGDGIEDSFRAETPTLALVAESLVWQQALWQKTLQEPQFKPLYNTLWRQRAELGPETGYIQSEPLPRRVST